MLFRRLQSLKRSDRLRAAGWAVLALGVVAGAVYYWVQTQNADPELSDLTALGYARSLHHQMGVMMGQFGIILSEWQDTLASPAGKAVLIALGAGLLAICFFRAAWVIDHDEEHG